MMSKINVEINLDSIIPCETNYTYDGDEQLTPVADSLEEFIKNQVIEKVVEKYANKVVETIDKEINDIIAKQIGNIEEIINTKLNNLMEEFLTTPFDTRDKYGDIIETNVTVKSMLKKACDSFVNEIVDSKGNRSSSIYDTNTMIRSEYIIKKIMKDDIELEIKRMSDNAMKSVRERISKAAQESLGKKLADLVGIDTMLFNNE